MRIRRSIVVLAVLAVALTLAAPASAGTPGTWEKVGNNVGSNQWLPGVVRTDDGYLHAVWGDVTASFDDRYVHRRFAPNGSVGTATNKLTSDALHSQPKLVLTATGLRLLSSRLPGGTFVQATGNADGDTWSAWSSAGTWPTAYASEGIGAGTLSDGTPIVGGARVDQIYWHSGTVAGMNNFQDTITNGDPNGFNLAVDRANDEVWAVWRDGLKEGVWAQTLPDPENPTRGPGSVFRGDSVLVEPGQVAITSRIGGGVYAGYCVGYPTCTSARVWELGTNRTVAISGTRGLDELALGMGPGGRIWATWFVGDGGTGFVYASRSNPAVTKFGAPQRVRLPRGSSYVYDLAIEGSLGRADILANAQSSAVLNMWHTQVLPGLSLSASPTRWDGDSRERVTFTVKDAGQAVQGANVRVGSRHCTTNGSGRCSIAFPKLDQGRLNAVATKGGYGKDELRLTVRA